MGRTPRSKRRSAVEPSHPPPPPPPPSASSSPPTESKPSAPVSLAAWLHQASPSDLLELQSLIDGAPRGPASLVVRTLAEVAEWFALDVQTVKQWRSGANGCPGQEGAYNIQEIARWRFQRLKAISTDPTRKAELEQAQLELTNARLEIKLQKESGELVTRSAAKAAISQMFARLKAQLEPLPETLAPLVSSECRADFLRDCAKRVQILFQQLANFRFERDVSGGESIGIDDSEGEAA